MSQQSTPQQIRLQTIKELCRIFEASINDLTYGNIGYNQFVRESERFTCHYHRSKSDVNAEFFFANDYESLQEYRAFQVRMQGLYDRFVRIKHDYELRACTRQDDNYFEERSKAAKLSREEHEK